MSFFLSFSSFKLGKYSEALKYWEQFMNKIGEKDNTYYNDIKNYIKSYVENDQQTVVSDEVKDVFLIDDFSEIIPVPACPNCDRCELWENCLARKNVDLSIKILNQMKKRKIDQLNLKNILT